VADDQSNKSTQFVIVVYGKNYIGLFTCRDRVQYERTPSTRTLLLPATKQQLPDEATRKQLIISAHGTLVLIRPETSNTVGKQVGLVHI
jgi:hypothetical protein